MSDDQIHWLWSNIRIVIGMALPFVAGIAWIVVRLAWKRRFSLRELLLLVTFFAFACGFALFLRYGPIMPMPGEDWELESLEELRSK